MRHPFVFVIGCIAAILLMTFGNSVAVAQLTPLIAIDEMGRGINLGNTLEPPLESDWNNGPAEEHYFDDYVSAGFSTVRVPVRWDLHTDSSSPYSIDAAWLSRVEQVVDWGLTRGLYIILNAHHEDWLKQDYANPATRARFDAIWTQVADHFKDKPEKLLFEIINEPFGMSREEVDDLNARTMSIIRASNPTRIVIYSGWNYSGPDELIGAAVPDDNYLLGYFHAYNPWSFAGLGEGTWGTTADRNELSATFQRVADWSLANGVPVMLSEFGAVRETDFNSRMAFYAAYVEECLKHNFAFQVWDDGGMFQVYQREERAWNEEKDLLLDTYLDGPTRMTATLVADTAVSLSWVNRSTANAGIVVERRLPSPTFQPIAELAHDATAFVDTAAAGGTRQQYRVVATFPNGPNRVGYPVEIFVPATERSSFHGSPFMVPGTIEAEDFDEGGEGLTYHDTDEANIPGAYRQNVSVDIEARSDGGFQLAYIESGEWLEYTIDVAEAGRYDITTWVASLDGGGRFGFVAGSNVSGVVRVPKTNSWETLAPVTTAIDLQPGVQILRLRVLSAFPFNIDYFILEKAGSTGIESPEPLASFSVFPNPARDEIRVTTGGRVGLRIDVFNLLGQLLLTQASSPSGDHRLLTGGLPAGLYVVRVSVDGQVLGQRTFVRL